MEKAGLINAGYWDRREPDLRLDSRRFYDTEGLDAFLEAADGRFDHCVLLATSGSSGRPKLVVLAKEALLASARAVNEFCGVEAADCWLNPLSSVHVGGLGIHARAHLSGSAMVPWEGTKWDRSGLALVAALEEAKATLTSLTPTHVSDLVAAARPAPRGLRGVFLGGGIIHEPIVRQARELGWPLWASYGMSETCSQVATSLTEEIEWLPILPLWRTQTDPEGRLSVSGAALFRGYLEKTAEGWRFDPAGEWHTCGDRCEIRDGSLRFVGRADDAVKVCGEWVSLSKLNAHLATWEPRAVVVAVPDLRRGQELVLVCEEVAGGRPASALLALLNASLDGIEHVQRAVVLPELPRTAAGKFDLQQIRLSLGS